LVLNCLDSSSNYSSYGLDKSEPIKAHLDVNIRDDSSLRREYPIESVLPANIDISRSKTTKEERGTRLLPKTQLEPILKPDPKPKKKRYDLEKWVDNDVSDTSSQKRMRPSFISSDRDNKVLDIISGSNIETAKSKELFSRNSDGLYSDHKFRTFPKYS
jgi:hypothetical protein